MTSLYHWDLIKHLFCSPRYLDGSFIGSQISSPSPPVSLLSPTVMLYCGSFYMLYSGLLLCISFILFSSLEFPCSFFYSTLTHSPKSLIHTTSKKSSLITILYCKKKKFSEHIAYIIYLIYLTFTIYFSKTSLVSCHIIIYGMVWTLLIGEPVACSCRKNSMYLLKHLAEWPIYIVKVDKKQNN